MSEEGNEFVERYYRCRFCNKTHIIKLEKTLLEGRSKFPFPYVFLHDYNDNGNFKELLTVLYIDNNLQIRSVDVQESIAKNLFSKEQVIAIMKPILEENERLRTDVARLTKELNNLRKIE
ncbi:MAG: hypothetical protein ACTSQJ_18295 [Promethearchaeota archaeon]